MVVPSVPRSVAELRHFAVLACASCSEEARDDVALLVSEVATNALVHGSGDVELRVLLEGGVVRVEVGDGSRVRPVPRSAGVDAEGGRGLALVQALAASWGTRETPTGKVVWFEVRT
ncbi:MAG: domain S-box protein [Frankiales bacterium]|nr:domain S-box protein [Frankiales bacterium]